MKKRINFDEPLLCNFCEQIIEGIPFKCSYCAIWFCSNHRLPEKHNCKKLPTNKDFFIERFSKN